MLVIKSYNENYRNEWDSFVMNSDDASLFHLTGWKDAVEKTFGHKSHYSFAAQDDKITGILPLFDIKSKFFGHALVSVPFGVYGGISAIDQDSHESLKMSAETLASAMSVDYLELRSVCSQGFESHSNISNNSNDSSVSNISNGWFLKDLYVTFKRPLCSTVDESFEEIPRKQRRMIRQGMKFGLHSKVGGLEYLDQFYAIYARNVRDLGTPVYPLTFFRNLMNNFRDALILSVWKDGQMVAGVLTFVFKDILMPYFGGGMREYFHYAINDFMYWELMKYGCENGYKLFDFGRSKKDTGSFHFKRHWGFEPTELPYGCYLVNSEKVPNVSPVNPKYQLLINMWKRLPLPMANWLGPKVVRGIP
jgi:FemAB-related protein (PEP-CTERM system-associated)